MEIEMEEDALTVEVAAQCEAAQLCNCMINLAAQVDVTRDPDARLLLITTMRAVAYALNPPQGDVREFKPKK
jgi:hypothetical protein